MDQALQLKYIYIYKTLWPPFCGWGASSSSLCRATTRRQFTFYQKFLVLIRSTSKGWKAEMTLKSSSDFELVNHPTFTKYKLKPQLKLTQLWPLIVDCFRVSSQSYLAGIPKICFFCTYVDQMIIQQRLLFCFKFSFTKFLLLFFPLFSNVFTNILKIYELPKIYNKILKKLLTIIIYQVNSMSQLHLASELYWKCTLGGKGLFWH